MRNIILFKKGLIVLFLSTLYISVFSQVSQQWVKRYNGTGNFSDEAKSLALDAAGNIFVAGRSTGIDGNYDYVTIKYNPAGKQVWVRRYNGSADLSHNEEGIAGIAVDRDGNIYVTGYSNSNDSEEDFATIKYDNNGNELWVKRYNGTGNGSDRANAIAVDRFGSVYVTGKSFQGIETSEDYVTIKYDTNGKELWVKKYDGQKIGVDVATAIAVDTSGNVYVTGYSVGGEDPSEISVIKYATVKYNALGKQLWVRTYLGVRGGSQPAAIAVGRAGSVYVTGRSAANTGDEEVTDYATIRYDTNGKQLWVKRYNGPGDYYDGATSLAVDTAGNVHVTGYSFSDSTGQDYTTIKYDTSGKELWLRSYNHNVSNGDDAATAITLDSAGNVYATGYSSLTASDYQYATVKYNAAGKQLWIKRYGSANLYHAASSVVVDRSGNVYVTGQSYADGTGADYATIKYIQSPPLTVNAGEDKTNYYLPFGPTCSPLTVKASGGTLPYKYSWLPANASSQTIIVCPVQTTTYTVTVIDANGLKASDQVKVNVNDVRCGNNNQKVLVCHKAKTLCVTPWEAFWHLLEGDVLGKCPATSITSPGSKNDGSEVGREIPKEFRIYNAPNPASHIAKIYYELPLDGKISIKLYDAIGREVAIVADGEYKAGSYNSEIPVVTLSNGVYYYQAIYFTATRPVQVKNGKMLIVK